jgi:hypothetical protein
MTEALTNTMIWTGGIVGVMKLLDFLLGQAQKKWLTSAAERARLWLSYQRAGRYISLVRSRKVQFWFSLFTHFSMLFIVSAFLAKTFLGLNVDAYLELGHPRVYTFQVWIDVLALIGSTIVVSFWIHPRISICIAAAPTLPRYF